MSDTPKSYGQIADDAYNTAHGVTHKEACRIAANAVIAEFVRRVREEAEARYRELEPESVGYSSNALLMAFDQLAKEVEK